MFWIVCCGAPLDAAPVRCGGESFEKYMSTLPEAATVPYDGRPMKAAGVPVFCAPGRRAAETAAQVVPGGEPREEPLLAAPALRPWSDRTGEHSPGFWRFMAARQAAKGDPRQPESRRETLLRADSLIARLEKEGEDCVLVADEVFLPLLLDRFRVRGYSMRRSGIGRIKPWEQFLLTPRSLHCGGCAHNCLLSNPGCGVGKDKARRLAQRGGRG